MRVEERQKYANEVTNLRSEYEKKLLNQKQKLSESDEIQRKWLDEREKVIIFNYGSIETNN